jgi:hypothetical protein
VYVVFDVKVMKVMFDMRFSNVRFLLKRYQMNYAYYFNWQMKCSERLSNVLLITLLLLSL